MRKSVIIETPQEEKPLTVSELIIFSLNSKPMSAHQLTKKLNGKFDTIHPKLCNMVKNNEIESILCPNCEIGRMYKKK